MEENEFYEGEQTTENPSPLTYDDIYNAMYNAVIDANTEMEIQAAENAALEEENSEEIFEDETTEEVIYQVEVTNYPQTQSVNVSNLDNIDFSTITDAILENQEVVDFSTQTDAHFYTVEPTGIISSADAQSVALMLEIRNIVLLFFLLWLVTYIVRFIKNTVMKFTKGKGDSI